MQKSLEILRKDTYGKITRALASDKFFWLVVGMLVFQALWIALSGRFPMAYDEQNHLGVIKLYASHLWPFWAEQPAGLAPYSAVSRDPSYMYHWLMSWPYHVLALFIKTDGAMVLAYRFISVGLFTAGVVLYRRLLLRTDASRAIIHTVFAIFVLTPTVPFLAGQMNYDNLLFLLVAAMLLLTTSIITDLRSDRLDSRQLALFVSLGLLTGLVKFPFLAILLALSVWLLAVFIRRHGRRGWRRFGSQFMASARALSKPAAIGMVLLVLVASGLFAERYGGNFVRYHTPIPECDQVLDIERCSAFGPWKRNYDIYQAKVNGELPPIRNDILSFAFVEWGALITWQFFYTLNGPIDNFSVGVPLPLPYRMSLVILLVGIVLALVFWRPVVRRPFMKGLVVVALFYCLVLLLQNYSDFLHLHIATAIQARYLVLVLPILYLVLALAYARCLRSWPSAKAMLAGVVMLVLLTQGGGIGVFIMRSNQLWWWQNPVTISVNQTAQRLLRPIIIAD